jgi:hypothetical protein
LEREKSEAEKNKWRQQAAPPTPSLLHTHLLLIPDLLPIQEHNLLARVQGVGQHNLKEWQGRVGWWGSEVRYGCEVVLKVGGGWRRDATA